MTQDTQMPDDVDVTEAFAFLYKESEEYGNSSLGLKYIKAMDTLLASSNAAEEKLKLLAGALLHSASVEGWDNAEKCAAYVYAIELARGIVGEKPIVENSGKGE